MSVADPAVGPSAGRTIQVPGLALTVFRGIGQVFFQENAASGALFLLGIAVSSPVMAVGALVGAAIGTATASVLKLDRSERSAGIFGFNATLVGIATLFFFRPGFASISLLAAGCILATLLTWLGRRHLPFPTYTAPFIVVTWVLFLVGSGLGAVRVEASGPMEGVGPAIAALHGVSQVMFQASVWTGLLFLAGIAIHDAKHAAWVLAGSIVGMAMGGYHATAAGRALDPEQLVDRAILENVGLGLYGYNATLAAVALFLWRRSLIPPLLGILLSVPLTDLAPLVGLPALTSPFVIATWLVLALGALDGKIFRVSGSP